MAVTANGGNFEEDVNITITDAATYAQIATVDSANNAGTLTLTTIADTAANLVTNSGGPPPGSFEGLTPAQWDAAVGLILSAVIEMVRAALPGMRE